MTLHSHKSIYPYLVQAGPRHKVVMQISREEQIPVSLDALRGLMEQSTKIYALETFIMQNACKEGKCK